MESLRVIKLVALGRGFRRICLVIQSQRSALPSSCLGRLWYRRPVETAEVGLGYVLLACEKLESGRDIRALGI